MESLSKFSWSKLLVAVISLSLAEVIMANHSTHHCPAGFYVNSNAPANATWQRRCQPCSTCQTGYGVKRHCAGNLDTVCQNCIPGKSFAVGWGSNVFCRSCTLCGNHRSTVRKCTTRADTVCGACEKGYYWNNVRNECQPCSWCFADSLKPRNRYVVRACKIPDIPEEYQCAKLRVPYKQPTWIEQTTKENSDVDEFSGYSERDGDAGSGSQKAVKSILTDDEDLDFKKDNTKLMKEDTTSHFTVSGDKPTMATVSTEHKPRLEISNVIQERVATSKITTFANRENQKHLPGRTQTDLTTVLRNSHSNTDFSLQSEAKMQETYSNESDQRSFQRGLTGAVVALSVVCLILLGALVALAKRHATLTGSRAKFNADRETEDDSLLSDVVTQS